LPHFSGVSRKHVHVSNHRRRRESEGYFHRPIRDRSPSDVRERITVPSRHAAGAWLVLGGSPDRRDDAISDMAALLRGKLPRPQSALLYRIPQTGAASSFALPIVLPPGRGLVVARKGGVHTLNVH